ncbi:Lysophosphatidylcholine acyltransferase 2 [Armadillidium vulgare]|nr:Lysophosphatidylcholine acyltransferase 2 [Armadillidium vulgare]
MEKNCQLNGRVNGMKNIKVEDITHNQASQKKSPLNPFVHRLPLCTLYDNFKMIFMSIFVLPIRIFVIITVLLVGYVLTQIGLYGLSKEDLTSKPLQGWRRRIRWCLGFLGRMMMRCYAFHWVKIKGRLASRSEAPIIVVGPHSSFMDAITIFWSNVPGLVNRIEDLQLPFFGKYITFTQPVSICREDSKSRKNSILEIKRRATSKEDWPQLIIFPEGTCTNRSCLITFKQGAFYPGVPVQPLVIRFPNKMDSITWTWDGPGAARMIWTTLCQFHNYCELEYLPVYYPSNEEIADPSLCQKCSKSYGRWGQAIKAIRDAFHKETFVIKVTRNSPLVYFNKYNEYFEIYFGMLLYRNITVEEVEEVLNHYSKMARTKGKMTLFDLSLHLGVAHSDPSLQVLFDTFDKEGYGVVSFKDYLTTHYAISKEVSSSENMNLLLKLLDKNEDGKIFMESFIHTLSLSLRMTEAASVNIFCDIDADSKGFVSPDDCRKYFAQRPEYLKLLQYNNGSKNVTRFSPSFCNGLHKKYENEEKLTKYFDKPVAENKLKAVENDFKARGKRKMNTFVIESPLDIELKGPKYKGSDHTI